MKQHERKTDLEGVKFVAKQLVMVDIHLTEYSPIVIQHPFTSSGIAAAPSKDGLRLLDIIKSEEDLRVWQGYMKGLIDNAKSAYEIYVMVRHGEDMVEVERSFEGIRKYLKEHNIEGLVFWFNGEPACKI